MRPEDLGTRPTWNQNARGTSAFTLVEHWHFMTGIWTSKRRARRVKGRLKAAHRKGS